LRLDQRRAALLLAWGPAVHATHQAIAGEPGNVREMVSRLLGNFAGRKLVRVAREEIEVIDTEDLRRRAGDEK
jgi:CRP/FNR family transcriptional regulator, anaerobic regulatory protein